MVTDTEIAAEAAAAGEAVAVAVAAAVGAVVDNNAQGARPVKLGWGQPQTSQ
jgi:hypothetical protein